MYPAFPFADDSNILKFSPKLMGLPLTDTSIPTTAHFCRDNNSCSPGAGIKNNSTCVLKSPKGGIMWQNAWNNYLQKVLPK